LAESKDPREVANKQGPHWLSFFTRTKFDSFDERTQLLICRATFAA
jgi:hypothetical protein